MDATSFHGGEPCRNLEAQPPGPRDINCGHAIMFPMFDIFLLRSSRIRCLIYESMWRVAESSNLGFKVWSQHTP